MTGSFLPFFTYENPINCLKNKKSLITLQYIRFFDMI